MSRLRPRQEPCASAHERATERTAAPGLSRRTLLSLGFVWLGSPSVAEAAEPVPSQGQPTFTIFALTLPPTVEQPRHVDKELRTLLKKAAKGQDWGAGKGNHIEARFQLRRLDFEKEGDALIVKAALVGKLPGGKAAESTISFGGAPSQKAALTKQVLRIIATGVIVRLAELERKRRGL